MLVLFIVGEFLTLDWPPSGIIFILSFVKIRDTERQIESAVISLSFVKIRDTERQTDRKHSDFISLPSFP